MEVKMESIRASILIGLILAGASWAESTFTKADYSRLGFTQKNGRDSILPTAWEKEKFGLVCKERINLKSRFPSPLGKTWYYRFVVEEEIFQDSLSAASRLDSLFVKPPKLGPEANKVFPLRDGFAMGNRVVVIRTDAAAFKPMLKAFTISLRTLAANPKSKKSLADSLGTELKKKALAN